MTDRLSLSIDCSEYRLATYNTLVYSVQLCGNWNFRSHVLLKWISRSLVLSFLGTFVPWNFRSLELLLLTAKMSWNTTLCHVKLYVCQHNSLR